MTTAARAGQDHVAAACGGFLLLSSARARSRPALVSRRTAMALAGGREARYLASSGRREDGVAPRPSPAPAPQARPRPRPGSPRWRGARGPLAIFRLARVETYSAQQCTVLLLALLAVAPEAAANPAAPPGPAGA